MSLSSLPALKTGTLLAAILISSPALGFLPVRAALPFTLKLPKPVKRTSYPLLSAAFTESKISFKACSAFCLVSPDTFESTTINSDFVIDYLPPINAYDLIIEAFSEKQKNRGEGMFEKHLFSG